MLFKVRITVSKDGEPWTLLSEGALIPGFPEPLLVFVSGQAVPSEAVEQFQAFDVGEGGSFDTQIGSSRFRFTALRVHGFEATEQWLDTHHVHLMQIAAAATTSIELLLRVAASWIAAVHLNLN